MVLLDFIPYAIFLGKLSAQWFDQQAQTVQKFSSFISHILKKYIQINQLLQSKLGSKYKIQ